MSKPFRPAPRDPKPWKGWLPAELVVKILAASCPATIARAGIDAMNASYEHTTADKAWQRALAQVPRSESPVFFTTMIDTSIYIEALVGSHEQGLTLEQGMAAFFTLGLEQLSA